MANPIITLTTDYGTNDHLVGTLKGVILKIHPDVTIVDITHHVTPFDFASMRALSIGAAYSHFPNRTILRGDCRSGSQERAAGRYW